MTIIFDMKKMETKLIIALIILFIFTLLYIMLPKSEFGIISTYKNEMPEISNIDLLYYSVQSQVGSGGNKIHPISWKTKVLTMCQLILGYAVILI
jgi:hypothetical protein